MPTSTTLTVSPEVMAAIDYINSGRLNRDICTVLDPHINAPSDTIYRDPVDGRIVSDAEGRLIGFIEQLIPKLSCFGLVGELQNGLKMDKEWAAYATPFIPRRNGAALLIAAHLNYLEACPEEFSDLIVALACRSSRVKTWLSTIRLM